VPKAGGRSVNHALAQTFGDRLYTDYGDGPADPTPSGAREILDDPVIMARLNGLSAADLRSTNCGPTPDRAGGGDPQNRRAPDQPPPRAWNRAAVSA
jgi:hypothetical protein